MTCLARAWARDQTLPRSCSISCSKPRPTWFAASCGGAPHARQRDPSRRRRRDRDNPREVAVRAAQHAAAAERESNTLSEQSKSKDWRRLRRPGASKRRRLAGAPIGHVDRFHRSKLKDDIAEMRLDCGESDRTVLANDQSFRRSAPGKTRGSRRYHSIRNSFARLRPAVRAATNPSTSTASANAPTAKLRRIVSRGSNAPRTKSACAPARRACAGARRRRGPAGR